MEPELLPYEPDLDYDAEVSIPAANFVIEIGAQPDNTLLVRITTRPAGSFTLADTAPGRPGGPQQIEVVAAGVSPADVFICLSNIAVVAAERVADQSGTPWSPPLLFRIKRWWAGVRNRDASQA